jgi:hypothetical protein
MNKSESIRRASHGLLLLAAVSLADCSADRLTGGSAPDQPPAATDGRPSQPSSPIDMTGRWRLVIASGGACGMAFAGTPGASEGSIAPEGGCPGSFFTSRRWAFEQGLLAIRDHTGKVLTQLKQNSATRFDGQTDKGEPLWLER